MPTYSITAPNGKTYRISGPDGASQEDVQAAVIAQHPDAMGETSSRDALPDGRTRAELEQELALHQAESNRLGKETGGVSGYVYDYFGGMKKTGKEIGRSFKEHPIKSTLTAPVAALEPVAHFVGSAIGDASAVVHSAIDKIPGSQHVGFDPKATFAQRRQEYREGIGAYTDPQTRLGQNASDAIGAVFKPVADTIGLAGKTTGVTARAFGASEESVKSIEEQTNAVINAALLAKSMRPSAPAKKAIAPAKVPNKSELKAAAQEAYANAEKTGAVVKQESFTKIVEDIQSKLKDEGFDTKLNPSTAAAIEHITQHEGPLTIKQLETYRKVAKNAQTDAAIAKPADARLAGKVVDAIDNYMDKLSESDIVSSTKAAASEAEGISAKMDSLSRKAQALPEDLPLNHPKHKAIEAEYNALKAKLADSKSKPAKPVTDAGLTDAKNSIASLNEARSLWSRYRKTEIIDELVHRAELSEGKFSQSGISNALITEFRQLAKNPKKMRGFNAAERAAIENVAKGGGIAEKTLRQIGKLSPEGAIPIFANLGAVIAGGPALAIPGATGFAARRIANSKTIGNAAKAQEIMRAGPGYKPPVKGDFGSFNVNPLLAVGATETSQPKRFRDYVTVRER